jgi:hypothetical protein
MNVKIIYLTKQDKKLSGIANDIASNIIIRLQPLLKEIKKEEAKIIIYFGKGDSKIKVTASPELEQAISRIL